MCGGGEQFSDRIGAGSGQKQQVGTQGRPCRLPGQPVEQTVGALVEAGNHLWPGEVFGGEVEGVEVAGGGGAEPDGGVLLLALQGGGGLRCGVAGQDLLEQLGGGPRVDIVGLDHRVRVPVPDHREVDVVGAAAAGQHGVELLPGFLTGHDAMHGVGGDTLRGVHGGGVAELGGGSDVVGGQGDDAAVPRVPHPQTTGPGQVEDGPPVAVFHPVGCADTEPAVVAAGDDQVADAGPVAVGQLDLPARGGAGEAVISGALVEACGPARGSGPT